MGGKQGVVNEGQFALFPYLMITNILIDKAERRNSEAWAFCVSETPLRHRGSPCGNDEIFKEYKICIFSYVRDPNYVLKEILLIYAVVG